MMTDESSNEELKVRKQQVLHVLLLVSLGFLIYSNTFSVPFVLDDIPNIVDNPVIRDWRFFLHPSSTAGAPVPQAIKDIFPNRYIGYLSLAVNYHLHGYATAGYHMLNLSIHLVNSLLVYWLLILTFRTPALREWSGWAGQSRNTALFVALLFVSHPLQTQAVTYVIQRFASLATLFYLASLSLYIRSRLSAPGVARVGLYLASLLAAVCAMRTKEMTFTLPFVIVLYEMMFLEGARKTRILQAVPFLLTLALIPLTAIYEKGGLAAAANIGNRVHLDRWDYLATEFRVVVTYIRHFFPPVIQNLDYDYPLSHSFTEPAVLRSAGLIVLALATAVVLLLRARKGGRERAYLLLLAFGILWFFITLAPESGLVPIADVIFEHRLYLPSTGFFIAAASAGMLLREALRDRLPIVYRFLPAVAFALVLLFSAAAYARNGVWRSELSLWKDTVGKSPHKARPHNNYGLALQKADRFEEALSEFRTTLELEPAYPGAHLNIGSIYQKRGMLPEALLEFQTALNLSSDSFKAHNNIGVIYFRQGRFDDALREYDASIEANPGYAEPNNNKGAIYLKQGRFSEAIAEFQAAVKKKPFYVEALNNSGEAYLRLNRPEEAIQAYEMVKRAAPNYLGVYVSLAEAYRRQGRMADAIRECRTALALKPDYAEARQECDRLQMNREMSSEK